MSYSDEPNVIREGARSKKIYFVIGGGFLLFFALLASVVLYPRILEYQKEHTPVGPHEGNFYSISLDGEPFSLELARPEEFDYHLRIFLEPVNEGAAWRPDEYSIAVDLERAESERLDWDPETESFGPSVLRFHPQGDFRFDLEIRRGEETVWSGRRWFFGAHSGAHAH